MYEDVGYGVPCHHGTRHERSNSGDGRRNCMPSYYEDQGMFHYAADQDSQRHRCNAQLPALNTATDVDVRSRVPDDPALSTTNRGSHSVGMYGENVGENTQPATRTSNQAMKPGKFY